MIDKEKSREKPDKLALKNKLFNDKQEIAQKIINTDNVLEKELLKVAYDLINSYIEICQNRKKF